MTKLNLISVLEYKCQLVTLLQSVSQRGIKLDSVALHLNETQNKLSWIKLDLGRNFNSLSYERQTITNFSNNQYGKSWSNGINNNL